MAPNVSNHMVFGTYTQANHRSWSRRSFFMPSNPSYALLRVQTLKQTSHTTICYYNQLQCRKPSNRSQSPRRRSEVQRLVCLLEPFAAECSRLCLLTLPEPATPSPQALHGPTTDCIQHRKMWYLQRCTRPRLPCGDVILDLQPSAPSVPRLESPNSHARSPRLRSWGN